MTLEEVVDQAVERALDRHMGVIRQELAAIRASQPPRFLTIAQAAEAMGCHCNTVRRMVQRGELTYKRIGRGRGVVRIDARSIQGAGGER